MERLYSHLTANGSRLEPLGFANELSMEGYLIDNPTVLTLDDEEVVSIIGYELDWKKYDKSKGRIDLLVQYGDKTVGVVELKKDTLNESHLVQLKEYFSDKMYTQIKDDRIDKTDLSWIGILIGLDVSPALQNKLEEKDFVFYKDYPLYVITLKRYKSDNNIFVLSDVFKVGKKRGRDKTKYIVDGSKPLPKNRSVLALVRAIQRLKPDITASDLEGLFRERLIPSYPLLREESYFKDFSNDLKNGYYFSKPGELITIAGENYAVLNWWSINDMGVMEKIAKEKEIEWVPVP